MSDGFARVRERASRRLLAGTLTALTIAAGAASVWAQNDAARPAGAPAAAPASPAAVPPAPKPRTPRQVAEEIVPLLQRQKTPWQLYSSYAAVFTEAADAQQAQAAAGNPNDPHAKRSAQLRSLAALLTSMGEQAKIRDEIKGGQSNLPQEQRQSSFLAAGKELTRLLQEFVRQASALPQTNAG